MTSYLKSLIDTAPGDRLQACMEDPSLLDAALVEGANAQDEAAYHSRRADAALDLLRDERDAWRAERAGYVAEIKRLSLAIAHNASQTARLAYEIEGSGLEREAALREEIAHLRQGIAVYNQALDDADLDSADVADWVERDSRRLRAAAEGRQLEIKTEVGK